MNYICCDRCGQPIKEKSVHYTKEIYLEQPIANFETEYNGNAYQKTLMELNILE